MAAAERRSQLQSQGYTPETIATLRQSAGDIRRSNTIEALRLINPGMRNKGEFIPPLVKEWDTAVNALLQPEQKRALTAALTDLWRKTIPQGPSLEQVALALQDRERFRRGTVRTSLQLEIFGPEEIE